MNTRTLPSPWRFALDRHDDPIVPPATPPAPAVPPVAAPAVPPVPGPADDDPPLGPAGEKALEEWKRRAKEAEAKAKATEERVREFEDRDKTELEEAQAAAERATAEAATARGELLRQRVINETGLSAELAEFLPAGDEETVRAAAAKLAAATAAVPKPGPKPDPGQGSGRPITPTDYRTASKDEVRAKLAELGVRSYRG